MIHADDLRIGEAVSNSHSFERLEHCIEASNFVPLILRTAGVGLIQTNIADECDLLCHFPSGKTFHKYRR